MSILSRFMRGALASLALATATFSASAAPTTQLGFLIDASGSIGSTNFQTMRDGYVAALGALPTDGSIEVTIYTFSDSTTVVQAPTVVTAANLAAIQANVAAMAWINSTTDTALGIREITNAMTGSTNFDVGLRSIINIATDGFPDNADAAVTAAVNARTAGIDAMTAEALGASLDIDFLRDLVFNPVTGPCTGCGVEVTTPTNPMTGTPWILRVNDFGDFETAITAKVQAIVNVPEPGSIALAGLALVLVGVSRRSRKA